MPTDPHNLKNEGGSVGDSTTGTADMPIVCIDCGREFIWTSGERLFFSQKGLTNPPKRCKSCKKAKNDRVEAALAASSGLRKKVTVRVQCATCGIETTVPFYPSQGRPVLCRDCFKR
ncbi:MAG: zinc-ribbon domain containing protein [Acidobacteria bacterium]|nr:zinc-ribbon domain containing protein [Acidobacteriota bacterium]